jgi:F-type H+-transporting ATPase subunit gamma
MAGLKEIRIRIASVKSTQKITSAMKMVAAARLRKSQEKITRLRPYANKLDEVLHSIQKALEGDIKSELIRAREPEKILIVLVTSNRGLCGAFNVNALKEALRLVREKYSSQNQNNKVSFFAIGKKGADSLNSLQIKTEGVNFEIFDDLTFKNTTDLTEHFIQLFTDGTYDRIEMVYNQFKNAAIQHVITETFLPLSFEEEQKENGPVLDYIIEPNSEYLIQELIPKSLKIKMFKIIIDSFTSEHGARMTAMHQATDNASDLIRELSLHYNKARQSAITKEILDIVGGAEALR